MAELSYRETLKSPAAWGAGGSMAMTVSVLIASEFMPVSLLTPIARDLTMLEGQAGQAISISGFFAVVTSLFVARLTAGIDRKTVLTWFSGVISADDYAPAFPYERTSNSQRQHRCSSGLARMPLCPHGS